MIVSIHQPQYLPWLGVIDKIARSDLFILLDTVQFSRHGFQHRTLYSTERGQAYLSLAVRSKNHIGSHQTIAATKLANPGITRKHSRTLKQRYGRCRGWEKFGPAVQALLERDWDNMSELNEATLELTLAAFGIGTKLVRASALKAGGQKTDLVVALAAEVGARRYLSGRGAQAYLDCTKFTAEGIDVVYQDFVHPQYTQSHGGPFVPGCFALEWMLEEADEARAKFVAHLDAHHPIAIDVHGCEQTDGPAR
jgi:hypothetical protein